MNSLMDKFYERTELSAVICEKLSTLSVKSSNANFFKTSVSTESTNATQNISSKIRVQF